MNHLLFAFALCAALGVYPGGLALALAGVAWGAGRTVTGAGRGWTVAGGPGPILLAVGLGGLVLAPLPWPGDPVAPVSISWAAGQDLGGIGVSLAGLLALLLLASGERGRVLAWGGGWTLGALLVALSLGTSTWGPVLSSGGLGAEVARVLLGLGLLGAMAGCRGRPGRLSPYTPAAWAAGAGLALLLCLPQLLGLPFGVAVGAWWGLSGLLGLAQAVGAHGWGDWPRPGGRVRATGRLNVL